MASDNSEAVSFMPDSALDLNEPDMGVMKWYCEQQGIEYNRDAIYGANLEDLPGHRD